MTFQSAHMKQKAAKGQARTPVATRPTAGEIALLVQRAQVAPKTLTHAHILDLQRTLGNRRVSQLLQPKTATNSQSEINSGGKEIIQRQTIETMGGIWEDLRYKEYKLNHRTETATLGPAAFEIEEEETNDTITQGADMKLEFTPNSSVNASKVGLTQTIHSLKEGDQPFPLLDDQDDLPLEKHGYEQRTINQGQNLGTGIDRMYGHDNPVYGAERGAGNLANTSFAPQEQDTGEGSDRVGGIFNRLGAREGTDTPVSAVLSDTPQRQAPLPNNALVEFETTALALAGEQEGTYYGSVRWGYRTNGQGRLSLIDFAKVTEGKPTAAFMEAAQLWNQTAPSYGQNFLTQAFVPHGQMVQLPITNNETHLPLPPPAYFNHMKDQATQKYSFNSKGLSRKEYRKFYASFNQHVQNSEWDQALPLIRSIRQRLDTMNTKDNKYWKSQQLKDQYFAPFYNAIKAQERYIETQEGN